MAGVRNWQVQLTVAMGRAADNHQLLLQPYQMNELMQMCPHCGADVAKCQRDYDEALADARRASEELARLMEGAKSCQT